MKLKFPKSCLETKLINRLKGTCKSLMGLVKSNNTKKYMRETHKRKRYDILIKTLQKNNYIKPNKTFYNIENM